MVEYNVQHKASPVSIKSKTYGALCEQVYFGAKPRMPYLKLALGRVTQTMIANTVMKFVCETDTKNKNYISHVQIDIALFECI